MGDTDAPKPENPTNTACDVPKPSIDILKEAKPSANISISEQTSTTAKDAQPDLVLKPVLAATSDTVCELKPKKSRDVAKKVEELKNDATAKETAEDDGDEAIRLKEKAALKNSDIFSLKENKTLPCTVFSVGGAPAKTIHKTVAGNLSSDTIRSNASRQSQYRNPVTGIGVSSNDEFKNKPSKRKDGNPLLGVGYKDDEEFFNTPPSSRIPPGGYSKGLW